MEKKFSAMALSYGLARFDMEGVMSYCVKLGPSEKKSVKQLSMIEYQRRLF